MAFTILSCHAMQTIGQQKAEAGSVGISTRCVTAVGGPTSRTTAAMHLTPDKSGFKHWESKQFAITSLTPTNFLALGFWIYFHNVDIAAGDNNIQFFNFKRNGVFDLQLELSADVGGHKLNLIDSAATTIDTSDLNPFDDDTWHWIELWFSPLNGGQTIVRVDRVTKVAGIGDYRNDASDLNPSIRFEGQLADPPDANNTDVYIGPGYVAEDSSGPNDLLVPLGGRNFECITYRLGATSKKCDENDVDGQGEALDAGALVDTADDNFATSADYSGAAGDVIGATYAYDTAPDDGPAPHFNKWTSVPFGMKYVWITLAGNTVGTRTGRYGAHTKGGVGWDTASIAIGNRTRYTEVFGLPNVGVFPDVPSKNEVTAMGWYVDDILGDTFRAKELYFFAFCLEGDGEGNYLMKSRKVDKRTSLVGDGGGRA